MRLHEIELIERLRKLADRRRRPRQSGALRVRKGIGDDCAVISTGAASDLLITTDLFIEDVHFRRSWQSAHSVGHKVLTRGLSDIAAMGGRPRLAFLSVALPRRTSQRWLDDFLGGFLDLAKRYRVELAGGDTGSSPYGFTADIMVVGESPRGSAVMRSGARQDDEIWVTGQLGGAAAALHHLLTGQRRNGPREENPYFYPQARVEVGEWLRRKRLASAMMDISDGLSLDLFRLTEASAAGAIVDQSAIPCAQGASVLNALHGGDDFEILFTVPRGKGKQLPQALKGVRLTRIGHITGERGLRIIRNGRTFNLPVRGYQHF